MKDRPKKIVTLAVTAAVLLVMYFIVRFAVLNPGRRTR